MTDPAPNADAGAIRGVIAAAEFHISIAQGRVVDLVAAGPTVFSDAQRDAARELGELSSELNELVGTARSLSDAELAARGPELTARADRIVDRADDLRAQFPDESDGDVAGALPKLDVALDALLDGVLAVGAELTIDAPLDPDDVLWAAHRVTDALEEAAGLFDELRDRAASWHDAEASEGPSLALTPAAERAYTTHLKAAPERLSAAARALRLAGRRGHLVELAAFRRPASTRLRISDTWVDVTLLDESSAFSSRTYRVRVSGTHAGDPTAPGVPGDELAAAIADAVGLDLDDVEQRRQAHEAAAEALGELDARIAFRNSGRRGDPQRAVQRAAGAEISYADRPDSSQDLVDVLLDLHDEHWPVAAVLRDGLAAACRVLAGDTDELAGLERLLDHHNDDQAAVELVRALVHAYAAAALEHDAQRLRDPEQLRRELLATVRRLQDQQRAATLTVVHAVGARRLVPREDVEAALDELTNQGLLELVDALALRREWRLTAAGLTATNP